VPTFDARLHPVMARMLASTASSDGMSTGIASIDLAIKDVMLRGRMMILVGRAGAGKTAIVVEIVWLHLHEDHKVIVCAYDRGGDVFARHLAARDGVGGSDLEVARYLVDKYPRLHILDAWQLEDVIAELVEPDSVLAVDSLAEAQCREPRRGDNELADVEARLRALKPARAKGCWIVATAEGHDTPKYAGAHKADAVIALQHHDESGLTYWHATKPTSPRHFGWLSIRYGEPVTVANAPKEVAKPTATKSNKGAKRRRADNPPAIPVDKIERDVLAFVSANPGCSGEAIVENVKGRATRKREIFKRVCEEREGGWYVR